MNGGGAASTGAGKGITNHIKSAIGRQRDQLTSKLKEVFPNRFRVEIREEDGSRKKVSIEVRGSDYKHIANDILNNHIIPANKVNKLSKQINNSYCRKTSGLYKKRKDNIDKFYYMKVKGRRLYFNIARHKTKSKGKIKYVYRIHSIKKNCK